MTTTKPVGVSFEYRKANDAKLEKMGYGLIEETRPKGNPKPKIGGAAKGTAKEAVKEAAEKTAEKAKGFLKTGKGKAVAAGLVAAGLAGTYFGVTKYQASKEQAGTQPAQPVAETN